MSKYFWKYPVTCNAACHAASGVGPATDYAAPYGTPVHAPFAGTAQPYWTDAGGWGVRLVGKDETLIRRVEDRKGHDRRYSVSTNKLRGMGWKPLVAFEPGLQETVEWYARNEWWWRPVKERDPQYKAYMEQQYGSRPSR